jgi:2-polyprenyl-3-methyl-5-hydroxy-6-metoxy-1,4-benzoquinol methylase
VDQLPEANVVEIMRQVRERASSQRQKFALSSAASPRRNGQTAEDLRFLQSSQDLSQIRFSSHRKVVGDIIVFVKRALQQLLTPILERQSAYNVVSARLVAHLCERVEHMEEQVASALEILRAEETAFLEALREMVTGQLGAISQQQAEALQALQGELAAQNRERRAQERHLTHLLEEARKRFAEPLDAQQVQTIVAEEGNALDAFFAPFDEQFRGSRDAIKQRLKVYVPMLKETQSGVDEGAILDLGCGRGEWLELLQEEGLRARGVDRNRVLVEECRLYGLDVVESDLIAYLCGLPSGSLSCVTGFHIIEHLPFEVVLKLLDETVRVLRPEGMAIFETPNPQNLLVSTHDFYLDPTHRHPIPSRLMKFVAEVRGLRRVKIMHLHPFPEAEQVEDAGLEVAKRFNKLLYGPRDYAMIGWKA